MFKLIHPTSFRLFFLPWMVTWVLISPLFHIHTLDAQEDHCHLQVFLIHTVFSSDLPGEYSPSSNVHQANTQENQPTILPHFVHYSEDTLNIFSKNAPKHGKKTGLVSKSHLLPPKDFLLAGGRYIIPDIVFPLLILQQSSVSLRAPPSVSS
jgi:hypothetical protein